MRPRDMRRYWGDTRAPLYGPCRLMSSWLSFKKVAHRRKDPAGQD